MLMRVVVQKYQKDFLLFIGLFHFAEDWEKEVQLI